VEDIPGVGDVVVEEADCGRTTQSESRVMGLFWTGFGPVYWRALVRMNSKD
jgi:hypothetical protein